jgi:enoyl-[acyl-carrier protein] reductase I
MLDLTGKNALVTGIANNKSIAWGIAQQLHQAGANLGITYLPDERGKMEGKVKNLVDPLNPSLFLPCNVQDETQVQEVFSTIQDKWGQLDILIHCLAFASRDDLTGDFSNTSKAGFQLALDVSAYSLITLARGAKSLMTGVRVVPNYNVMGIAKSALEMNVRYLASELGPHNIRVNGISAGPIRTLASSAVGGILDMIHHVEEVAPLRRTVTQTEVGNTAAFLCSDLSTGMTGQILYVDSGYCIMGM